MVKTGEHEPVYIELQRIDCTPQQENDPRTKREITTYQQNDQPLTELISEDEILTRNLQESVDPEPNRKWFYFVTLAIIPGLILIVSSYSYIKIHGRTELTQNDYENINEWNGTNVETNGVLKSSELDDGSDSYGAYGPGKKYKNNPPEDIGYMNVYLRGSGRSGNQKKYDQYRFPAARYKSTRFPFTGPFISFLPKVPIFVERLTRQTILFSPFGTYIMPPLVNMYGQRFSVAELIASGYASLVGGGLPLNPLDIPNLFRPIPLIGPNIPIISPLTGGFNGGFRVNRYWTSVPKPPSRIVYNLQSNEDYNAQYEPETRYQKQNYKNPYYYKRNPYYTKITTAIPPPTCTTCMVAVNVSCDDFCDNNVTNSGCTDARRYSTRCLAFPPPVVRAVRAADVDADVDVDADADVDAGGASDVNVRSRRRASGNIVPRCLDVYNDYYCCCQSTES